MVFNYYSRCSRSRLRKRRRRRTYLRESSKHNLRIRHYYASSSPNNSKRYWDRIEGPTWTALDKCWLGYVIAKNKEQDEDKMRLYAKRIQKLERELEIEVSEFPHLGLYAFDEGYLTHNDGEDEEDGKEEEEKDEGSSVEDPYNGKEWNSTGAPL